MTAGLLKIIDDIAALCDDVLRQVSRFGPVTKKAGNAVTTLAFDDLAVGAEKAIGFSPSRELPVIYKIAKGALMNKVYIAPTLLFVSKFYYQLIVVALIVGGLYLSYEAAEKIYEWLFHSEKKGDLIVKTTTDKNSIIDAESKKIRSAILTDFILSIEIIVVVIDKVKHEPLLLQVLAVATISIVSVFLIYGIVAGLVKLDDLGFWFIKKSDKKSKTISTFFKIIGKFCIWVAPKIVKALSFVGAIAMLLVGGELLIHNIHALHYVAEFIPNEYLGYAATSLVVGLILIPVVTLVGRVVKYINPYVNKIVGIFKGSK